MCAFGKAGQNRVPIGGGGFRTTEITAIDLIEPDTVQIGSYITPLRQARAKGALRSR